MTNKLPSRLAKTNILNDNIKTVDYCYVSTHDYCNILISTLTNLIDEKKPIPEKLVERFFKVIVTSIECWSLNYDINIKRLKYIFDNVKMTDNILRSLFLTENFEAIQIFLDHNENMNAALLQNIMNIFANININKNINIGNSLDMLIENIIKHNDSNKIKIIFDYAMEVNSIYIINKILDSKYKPTDEDFINLLISVRNKDEPIELIKKCILNGIEIKKEHIQIYIQHIITSYYNADSFYNIFTYLYDNGSTYVSIYDILKCYAKISTVNLHNAINYLIDNINTITREDFILLCKEGVFVKNTKKIQQYFDDKEIQTIIFEKNLSYPIKITFNLNILRNECKKRNNIKQIQKILSDKIIPDEICLENACIISNNTQVIKLLHETYKIPFNDNCIINFAHTMKQNQLLRYILGKFKNNKLTNINVNDFDSDDDDDSQ
jgi:hypothetical protein